MKELKDYSGPYVPNLKYEDLSKEVLVKLLRAFSRECNVLPAYWAEEVRKRLGREVERECLLSTWTRIGKYETGRAMEAANLKADRKDDQLKATLITLGQVGEAVCGNQQHAGDQYGKDELQQHQGQVRTLGQGPHASLLGCRQGPAHQAVGISHGTDPGIADQLPDQGQTGQPVRRLRTYG